MMAAMHGFALLRCFVSAILVLAGCGTAQAQFYDLDGVYHCVTEETANPACQTAARPVPPVPPPPPPAGPTVDQVLARVKTQKVSVADLQLLQTHADAKEPRAVEALAWCKLNGLGGPPDPVAAFTLYGDAARLGITTAKANQIAVFETRLTPEQRQLVLLHQQTQ
jgi:TPR repeat protein